MRTEAGSRWRRRLAALAVPIAVAAALALWRGLAGDAVTDGIENRLIDLRFQLRGPRPAPANVVVIGIDEAALARLGWTPPPRDAFARAVTAIAADRPAVILLDLLLLDANPADPALDAAIRAAGVPVVLGTAVSYGAGQGGEAAGPAPGLIAAIDRSAMTVVGASQPPGPAPRLLAPAGGILAGARLGHVNIAEGGDRAARRLPLALWAGGDVFLPSLALSGGAALAEGGGVAPVLRPGRSLSLGGRSFATDAAGQAVVNHYGPPGSVETIGLLEVLDGKVPAGAFRGRAVFLGATAESLSDFFATPYGGAVPGVEVLATSAANLAGSEVPREGLAAGPAWVLLPALAAALVVFAGTAGPPLMASTLGVGVWAASLGLMQAAFAFGNLLPDATALVLTLIAATAWAVWRRMTDDRARAAVLTSERTNLARYVSPFLAEELARTRIPGFADRTQQASVLFVDVAGYTTLSESLTPEATSALVGRVQAFYEACATAHRGVLASFQGDGVMIVFGLPLPDAGDAGRAIACGREMLARIGGVTGAGGRGMPLRIRVSVHTGRVVAGIAGGVSHAQVTVNGDTVNVASRLQDVAKEHGVEFVVSGATLAAAGADAGFGRLGPVAIRGRSEAVEAWAALPGGVAG
ncbi:MAG: CHASE2 domain-containing protein [Paracoccaceae bacterium]